MRIRVTMTYEYDTDPEHYPGVTRTPFEIALYDIAVDAAGTLESAQNPTVIMANEIKED